MTAAICTNSEHLFEVCAAYFNENGYTVQRIFYGEPAKTDVVIIDHPYGSSLPTRQLNKLKMVRRNCCGTENQSAGQPGLG